MPLLSIEQQQVSVYAEARELFQGVCAWLMMHASACVQGVSSSGKPAQSSLFRTGIQHMWGGASSTVV